jgi:hypothetical protein
MENPVKIPPLPETDLARIAPLPPHLKRNALEQLRIGKPPYRYAPVRKCFPDILNVHTPLFGAPPRTPFEKITQTLHTESRTEAEETANLRVAEGLYNHAVEHDLRGTKQEFYPMAIGVGERVVFWQSLVLTVAGQPLVPFIDPRRASKRLTVEARRFVFSMMHERIRVSDPDFADVRLGIYQFSTPEIGPRPPVLYSDEGIVLYTFDELEEMVRETYAFWHEVCAERTERMRRSATGKGTGML